MRNSRKRIKRIRRRTLKMRGGNFDDPDTKDFMNSKFAALEQKNAELEANMPVQIGYKTMLVNGRVTMFPLFVTRNISVQDFWKYVGQGGPNNYNYNITNLFLPALYSLPNVRGLNIEECIYSFTISYYKDSSYEDNLDFSGRNVDALNAKYPGLFVK
jgi:hypothetical protein